MKKILFALTTISILSITGCKKDDDNDDNCTLSEVNIVGTYKITAVTSKASAGSPVVDEFANWDECEKDDLYEIAADNIITQTDSGLICDPSGGLITGYTLSDNVFSIAGIGAFIITSFNCNGFSMTELNLTGDGEFNMTYTRQ